jgi:hypothetical protein
VHFIKRGEACEATGQYWDALYYYREAEKRSSNILATQHIAKLEKKVYEEQRVKGILRKP